MSTESKPSIVFAHGLWADGSCFNKVMGPLRAEGYEVIASEHGLDSHAGDVDCVLRSLGRVSSPAILVGHSYGGSLITAAGTDDRVVGLVYIAALAPDETETSQSQQEKFPATDVFDHIEIADGRIWLLRSGIDCFAGDLTSEEKELVWATAMAPVADLFNQKVDGVALEDDAERVYRGLPGPHSEPGAGAVRRRAHGRHDVRGREQPRPNALPSGRRARRDPQPRDSRLKDPWLQREAPPEESAHQAIDPKGGGIT